MSKERVHPLNNNRCAVSREISENFVEICLYLPEISPILGCGVVAVPRRGNIFQFFKLKLISLP